MAFLNRPPCNAQAASRADGEVVALDAGTGKVRWRKEIGPSETSPLVGGGLRLRRRLDTATSTRSSRRTGRSSVDVPDRRPGQGRARARRRPRLRRLLRPPRLRARTPRTGKLIWRASAQQRLGGRGHVLLDAGRRLRPRLHRLDRRQGLLVRRHEREAALVARDRRLRLRLAGGLARSASTSARTAARFYAFDAATGDIRWQFEANGADLRLGDRDRRHRLLLDAEGPTYGARRARPGKPRLELPGRQVLAGRRRTRAGLPRRGTPGCTRFANRDR